MSKRHPLSNYYPLSLLALLSEHNADGSSLQAARLRSKSYFRHLCALAGALNILLLMLANLVGFVLGVDGVVVLWGHVWGGGGGWEGESDFIFRCPCQSSSSWRLSLSAFSTVLIPGARSLIIAL